MAHPRPFYKPSSEAAMPFAPFRCAHHLPLSRPFCWSRTYLQMTLPEVTSWAQNLPTSIEVISG